jgi:hypothetical protein
MSGNFADASGEIAPLGTHKIPDLPVERCSKRFPGTREDGFLHSKDKEAKGLQFGSLV